MKIDEIQQYFEFNGYPQGPITLNKWTTIINPEVFVKAHLGYLRSNPGNKFFMPYFKRLNKFYELTRKTN